MLTIEPGTFRNVPISAETNVWVNSVLNAVDMKNQVWSDLQNWLGRVQAAPPLSVVHTGMDMIVNVYGTRDIVANAALANGQKIGGERSEMAGFTLGGVVGADGKITNQLINIEIVGADHYDYMPMSQLENMTTRLLSGFGAIAGLPGAFIMTALATTQEIAWNKLVSDFCADLILNSQDPNKLNAFLEDAKNRQLAHKEGDKWVVTLPDPRNVV